MEGKHKIVVFDLDDTLYKEIDFLQSAYRYIADVMSNENVSENEIYQLLWNSYKKGRNAFETVVEKYGSLVFSVDWMLNTYRQHIPHISLDKDIVMFLDRLNADGVILGIISDGRFEQQMNKIDALGLKKYIDEDDIIINTDVDHMKPDIRSFKYFMDKYGKDYTYWYIGDNTSKDFIAPNSLDWVTICLLDDGRNIHKQNFSLDIQSLPNIKVKKMSELI